MDVSSKKVPKLFITGISSENDLSFQFMQEIEKKRNIMLHKLEEPIPIYEFEQHKSNRLLDKEFKVILFRY